MKLEITPEDARELLWEESDLYKIVENEIIGNRRWSIDYQLVIKEIATGKYYMDTYSVGATESQDESAWEYSEPNFVEVEPFQETVTKYRKVKT